MGLDFHKILAVSALAVRMIAVCRGAGMPGTWFWGDSMMKKCVMKKCVLMVAVLLLANLAGSATAEELLFERSLGVNRSVNIFSTDQFDFDIALGDHFFSPSNPVTLFDDLLIRPSDVGEVYEIVAGDPAFEAAEQRLTDARDEFFRLILSENQPGGRVEQRGSSESGFFLGLENLPGPDLAGTTLERIRLEVQRFTLAGDGGAASAGPPVDLQVSISIYGQPVPEPTGLWLLWSGLATLWGMLRRRWGRLIPARVPRPVRVPRSTSKQ